MRLYEQRRWLRIANYLSVLKGVNSAIASRLLIAANVDFATVGRGLVPIGETLNKARYGKLAYSP